MAHVTFITADGEQRQVEAVGGSLMTAAVQNGVRGIGGDCGGVCSCATCHVYVDPAWRERVGPPNPTEAAMLEFDDDARPESRLACQIAVRPELDGLTVKVVGR